MKVLTQERPRTVLPPVAPTREGAAGTASQNGQRPADAPVKHLEIEVAGSGRVLEVAVGPGTQVRGLLAGVRLDGYVVSAGPDQPLLGPEDDVFRAVPNGVRLYATAPAQAGGDTA